MNNFIKFHKITNDTELYELLYNKSPEEVEDLRKTNKGTAIIIMSLTFQRIILSGMSTMMLT